MDLSTRYILLEIWDFYLYFIFIYIYIYSPSPPLSLRIVCNCFVAYYIEGKISNLFHEIYISISLFKIQQYSYHTKIHIS